ncbi:hypothetical protein AGLY_001906 [Aphis glycines]|uniref:Uncharacterized protein n=1 Tax=Aphis glycines TaxID=307491 RepID=A0A6G0U483_APHGL|nr:hypothetical protein AGLY_001906 [Aphis glycines]
MSLIKSLNVASSIFSEIFVSTINAIERTSISIKLFSLITFSIDLMKSKTISGSNIPLTIHLCTYQENLHACQLSLKSNQHGFLNLTGQHVSIILDLKTKFHSGINKKENVNLQYTLIHFEFYLFSLTVQLGLYKMLENHYNFLLTLNECKKQQCYEIEVDGNFNNYGLKLTILANHKLNHMPLLKMFEFHSTVSTNLKIILQVRALYYFLQQFLYQALQWVAKIIDTILLALLSNQTTNLHKALMKFFGDCLNLGYYD